MDDPKRRELFNRLRIATNWKFARHPPLARIWGDGKRWAVTPFDGGTMRAVVEWAREVTGRQWLSVCAGVLGAGWVVVDDCGVVEGCDQLHATEAEAHVALAEWAAENRK